MGSKSKIEWTHATWEPVTGCTIASEGCRNCYAAALAAGRMQHHPSMAGLAKRNAAGVAQFTGEVRFNEAWLLEPLRWTKPMVIFAVSRGDMFHPSVPVDWVDRVFAVMALSGHHFFRLLTKRGDRMRQYLNDPGTPRRVYDLVCDMTLALDLKVILLADPSHEARAPKGRKVHLGRWPLPNVGIGGSFHDQASADEIVPEVLGAQAAMRFVSGEPLLGPVELTRLDPKIFAATGNALSGKWSWDGGPNRPEWPPLDEVIAGGESGKGARPMHPDWVRSLRDQCAEAGVPFFFKQWGEWLPGQNDPYPPDGGRLAPVAHWQDGGWGARDARRPAAKNYIMWEEDGTAHAGGSRTRDNLFRVHCWAARVGKKAAGAMLDGREHRAVAPQVTAHFERMGRAA